MNYVCGKSWRLPGDVNYHWFCTLDRGHAGGCEFCGKPKPEAGIFYEDDTELQEFLAKQRATQAKADAKAGRSGEP